MADILSPTGIEKPTGAEQHSRAMYNRNLDRTNQIRIDMDALKHAEWERIGQNDAPANTAWGPGMFNTAPLIKVVDKNSGFVVPGAGNDQLKVTEEGTYAFSWTLFNGSGASHGFYLKLGDPANSFVYASIPSTTVGNGDFACLPAPNFWLPANTTIQVRFSCSSANVLVNHRFRFTKMQG